MSLFIFVYGCYSVYSPCSSVRLLGEQTEAQAAHVASPLDVTRESSEADSAGQQKHVRIDHDSDLRAQLQRALQRIRQLQAERAHLLEMGNRLRARLKQAEAAAGPTAFGAEPPQDQVADLIRGRLRELEAVQYALTTRQLASARQATVAAEEDSFAEASARKPAPQLSSRQKRSLVTSSVDADDSARPASRSQSRNPQLLASVSSIGAESLSGVWRMLDDQPSFLTPRCKFPFSQLLLLFVLLFFTFSSSRSSYETGK